MRDNGQKWHGWKSSKDKTTGDQRTQRPNSHQTQKTKICWISKYFGKIIILRAEYSKVGFKKKKNSGRRASCLIKRIVFQMRKIMFMTKTKAHH